MPPETIHHDRGHNPKEYRPGREVDPVESSAVVKHWNDKPMKIEPLHHNEPLGQHTEHCPVTFREPRQQDDEGNDEVEYQQDQTVVLPSILEAVPVPYGLFRNVAVPDEHVLAVCDVCPEHREPEHKLAEVMVVLDGYCAFVAYAHALHEQGDGYNSGKLYPERSTEHIDAEDRGEPVRVGRHHKVEARKCRRHRQHRQSPRA